jgi:Sortase domain
VIVRPRRWSHAMVRVAPGLAIVAGIALTMAALGRSSPPAANAVGDVPRGPSSVGVATIDPGSVPARTIPVHPARLADAVPLHRPAPVHVRIAAIDVDARVVPVGVDPVTGTVGVPRSVHDVGWYRFGPAPGQPGSTVLVGHVDSATQGLGTLFHLRDVRPGDIVTIRLSDGTSETFSVVGMRMYPKRALPESVFERSGRSVLTLITCGGAFDHETRHYADNVVVFALPRSA